MQPRSVPTAPPSCMDTAARWFAGSAASIRAVLISTEKRARLCAAFLLAIACYRRPVSVVSVVPVSPSDCVVGQTLSGDVAERLKDPPVSFRIERRVGSEVEQLRHCTAAPLFAQHTRLRQAASGALADHGRRVVVEYLQQRSDGVVAAEIA